MRRLILALTAAAAVSPALAQDETPTPAPQQTPCTDKVHHDFDFWVGVWDVTDAQGTPQGTNTITREEYGCLILEKWVNTAGQTGQSYNFYDPIVKKWRQVWVSGGAVIDYTGGLNEEGQMVLEGKIAYQQGGVIAPFRGAWTANADGTVTQHFQQYDEKAKTWNDWFTGIYRKKAAQ
jgi:hypothetical protein